MFHVREGKFESRVFNSPIGIPHHSRWTITDRGELYLTGGVLKGQTNALPTTHYYEKKNNFLEQKADMKRCRSDHSMLFCKGYIYVVGGHVP